MKKKIGAKEDASPAQLIDARIEELGDWRGETLSRLRALIRQADPDAVEEWKWRGVPVWYHDGMICTGETYQDHVKVTFAKGASLEDPSGLFNAGLDGNARRAIDLHEGDAIDEDAFKALIRAAVSLNESSGRAPSADPRNAAASIEGTRKSALTSSAARESDRARQQSKKDPPKAAAPGRRRSFSLRSRWSSSTSSRISSGSCARCHAHSARPASSPCSAPAAARTARIA